MTAQLTWTPDMPSLGRAVAAIGVFDGVHVGHQALIHDALAIAREADALSVVITFDRDPDQVVTPASASPQLLTLADKLELLSDLGADLVLVVPFDEALARTTPFVFLDEVLLGAMTPLTVVVGYDFRFGHRAEGDVDALVRYGREHNFSVVAHDLVQAGGEPVTSTRIRALVLSGDVEGAAELLGRPHRVTGEVARGRGEGASLDAPTANLVVAPYTALPADGVYAGTTRLDGVTHPVAISVGVPPTFPNATDSLEAHVLDFAGDLYGRALTIEFLERLRDQRAFPDTASLAAAIAADVEQVRRIATR